MVKVTSKYQSPCPEKLPMLTRSAPATRSTGCRRAASSVSSLLANAQLHSISNRDCPYSTRRPNVKRGVLRRHAWLSRQVADGAGIICTAVDALIDTNILIYRYDVRFPEKQKIATDLLRRGIVENSVLLPLQAIVSEPTPCVKRNSFSASSWFFIPMKRPCVRPFARAPLTSSVGSTRTCGPMPSITEFPKSSRKILSIIGFTDRCAR